MLRKPKSKEVEMQDLANIIREYSFIPNRKIPLLISVEKLDKTAISVLKNAQVDVCAVMPEMKMIYAEIDPKHSILENMRKIENIKRISVSREVEVHDC